MQTKQKIIGWANVLTMRQGDGGATDKPYMGQPIYASELEARLAGERLSHYSHTVAIKPSGERAAQQQGGA